MIHSAMLRLLRAAGALLALIPVGLAQTAFAGDVREVTSPGGIKAWLAEDHASPLIALRFAFRGGSAVEPAERAGITRLMAGLLLAGSGDDDEASFRRRMQRAGVRISFQAGRGALYGSADILSAHRTDSSALLGAALRQPRFDEAPLARARMRAVADIEEAASDPRTLASDGWYRAALTDPGYARPPDGNAVSVAAIQRDDLVRLHARVLERSALVVAAAGDITPAELGALLDGVFGGLPQGDAPQPRTIALRSSLPLQHVAIAAPSSALVLGAPAPGPAEPDHAAARIVTHVLASGDLDSRLVAELRLRSGLVYSANAGIVHDTRATFLLGEVLTGNDKVADTLAALRATIARIAAEGPSAEEVAAAKAALIGNSLLMLDSTANVAEAMLYARLDGEPVDFVERRRDALMAVSLQDARRTARAMLSADQVGVVVASPSAP